MVVHLNTLRSSSREFYMLLGSAILLGYLWLCWGLYVLVVGLYRSYLSKKLTRTTIFLSIPFVATGFIIDVISNFTIATLIFLEWPKEFLVTDRLVRHIKSKKGWRCSLAQWICQHLLDPVDPSGSHCKI